MYVMNVMNVVINWLHLDSMFEIDATRGDQRLYRIGIQKKQWQVVGDCWFDAVQRLSGVKNSNGDSV